jgi:16S rRNA (adenine1518-N6/adenine1519-N6)-dimethyltransferase
MKRDQMFKPRRDLEQRIKSTKYSKILKDLGIKPNRNLGQNFLINDDLAQDQINFANLNKTDTVLEIGSGLGILTEKLAARAGKVIAIEYDKKLSSYLENEMPDNVELIYDDALKIQFPKFNKLVSNIPYQISSPLIFKLIDYDFELAILMFQSEFANRLNAKINTKDYSRLTVMAVYHFDIELLCNVPKENFLPIPRVDSAIIELIPNTDKKRAVNEQFFIELVKILFSERRKMIKNSITGQISRLNKFGDLKDHQDKFEDLISRLPNSKSRPEQLEPEELVELADEIYGILQKLKS